MRSPLPIGLDEVHLWLCFYAGITDQRLLESYRDVISPDERAQEGKFYFARDRHRYLVTRALVRTVLSRYASVHPGAWQFASNAYGRPEIANPELSDAGLSFNISHTSGLIVLVVTKHRAVGVDVENLAERNASLELANHYFSPAEAIALARVPAHRQQHRFFEYWTLKEAYIKARGMGLSLPLDKFAFHFPCDRRIAISIHPSLGDNPSRWQLWQFQPAPEYLMALCAERINTLPGAVSIRRIEPMAADAPLLLGPTRISTEGVSEGLGGSASLPASGSTSN